MPNLNLKKYTRNKTHSFTLTFGKSGRASRIRNPAAVNEQSKNMTLQSHREGPDSVQGTALKEAAFDRPGSDKQLFDKKFSVVTKPQHIDLLVQSRKINRPQPYLQMVDLGMTSTTQTPSKKAPKNRLDMPEVINKDDL